MTQLSTQISEASLPEQGRLESAGLISKRGSKSARRSQNDGAGVFARLFAGLLRKNQNIAGEKPGAEQTAFLTTANQAKEGGKKAGPGETLLVKSQNAAALKKQIKEELITPQSGQKPEKIAKKAGQASAENEDLVPFQLVPGEGNGLEAQNAGKNITEGIVLSEKGLDASQRKAEEADSAGIMGKKTGKRDEVAVSNESQRAFPLFQAKTEVKKPEMTAETRQSEGQGRNKRKERLPVDVWDLRSGFQGETAGSSVNAAAREQELIVELNPAGGRFDAGNPAAEQADNERSIPAESGRSFERMLAERLSGELSGDIVKQAAIVLRDGGEGTIRLSLKPETLGKVKIHLEMAENKVSGHIFVESEEALRAFEQEIHSLEQAFKDSGFAEATLDMALGSGDGRRREGEDLKPFYSSRLAVSSYDAGSEFSAPGAVVSDGFSAVNMLV